VPETAAADETKHPSFQSPLEGERYIEDPFWWREESGVLDDYRLPEPVSRGGLDRPWDLTATTLGGVDMYKVNQFGEPREFPPLAWEGTAEDWHNRRPTSVVEPRNIPFGPHDNAMALSPADYQMHPQEIQSNLDNAIQAYNYWGAKDKTSQEFTNADNAIKKFRYMLHGDVRPEEHADMSPQGPPLQRKGPFE
jgi:hypothetical protein